MGVSKKATLVDQDMMFWSPHFWIPNCQEIGSDMSIFGGYQKSEWIRTTYNASELGRLRLVHTHQWRFQRHQQRQTMAGSIFWWSIFRSIFSGAPVVLCTGPRIIHQKYNFRKCDFAVKCSRIDPKLHQVSYCGEFLRCLLRKKTAGLVRSPPQRNHEFTTLDFAAAARSLSFLY